MNLILEKKPINSQELSPFKKVVKIALLLNLIMFFVEFSAGIISSSLALITDSFDFLGDSVSYLITIFALRKSQKFQSFTALIKGLAMFFFGIFITHQAIYRFHNSEILPQSFLMIVVSSISFAVNFFVSILLFKFRDGNSNQKSIWMCSRNDVVNNFLVIIAGFSVYHFNSQVPDLLAALIIAILAIFSAFIVFKDVYFELKFSRINENH